MIGGAKSTLAQGHVFLRLRVERRVFDQAVDENAHMVLDLERLDVLVTGFLLYFRKYGLDNLICHVLNMRATFSSADGVNETDLQDKYAISLISFAE